MPFDQKLQRKILGHFATGVTVITSRIDENYFGMTASAVCSLSLDPPLVLACIEKSASMFETLRLSGCYALNILTDEQEAVSNRFAARGPKEFGDLDCFTAETGSPIFHGSLAYVDCRISEILPGGDHDIFIGEIVAGDLLKAIEPDVNPLLYYAGKYRRIADL